MCLDELASSAYYAGDMMAGLEASNTLLEQKKFPEEHKERIVGNFQQYAEWLAKQEEAMKIMQQEQMKLEVAKKNKTYKTRKPQSRRKKAKSKK